MQAFHRYEKKQQKQIEQKQTKMDIDLIKTDQIVLTKTDQKWYRPHKNRNGYRPHKNK